jgi:hypothetical protein
MCASDGTVSFAARVGPPRVPARRRCLLTCAGDQDRGTESHAVKQLLGTATEAVP